MKLTTTVVIPEELPILAQLFGGSGRADLIQSMAADARAKNAVVAFQDDAKLITEIDMPADDVARAITQVQTAFEALNSAIRKTEALMTDILPETGELPVFRFSEEESSSDRRAIKVVCATPSLLAS